MDEAAIEYCMHKKTAAIALIFPSVANDRIAEEILMKYSDIAYKKSFLISPRAGGGLLRQIYLGHPWLDVSGNQQGFINKKNSCFPSTGKLSAILFDNYSISKLRQIKEEIRSKYSIGNHSIHISDSTEETLLLAQVVFNNNSLKMLESGVFASKEFHDQLFSLKNWAKENNIDNANICIGGSGILGLLGLRKTRDIDFLYHGNIEDINSIPDETDCHNHQIKYYPHTIPTIIGDPRHHFWYMGMKFCSINTIIAMKEKRSETKDIYDVKLLKATISASSFNTVYILKKAILKRFNHYKILQNRILLFIKRRIRKTFTRF